MLLALLLLCVRVTPAAPVWMVLPLLVLGGLVGHRTSSSSFCQWTRLALCVAAWPQKLSLLLLLVVLCRNRIMRMGAYVDFFQWVALAILLGVAVVPSSEVWQEEAADPRDWAILVMALFAAAVSSPLSVQHVLAGCLLIVLRSRQRMIQDDTRWLLLPTLLAELPPLLQQQDDKLRALYAICSAVTLGACASMWSPLLIALLALHCLFFLG